MFTPKPDINVTSAFISETGKVKVIVKLTTNLLAGEELRVYARRVGVADIAMVVKPTTSLLTFIVVDNIDTTSVVNYIASVFDTVNQVSSIESISEISVDKRTDVDSLIIRLYAKFDPVTLTYNLKTKAIKNRPNSRLSKSTKLAMSFEVSNNAGVAPEYIYKYFTDPQDEASLTFYNIDSVDMKAGFSNMGNSAPSGTLLKSPALWPTNVRQILFSLRDLETLTDIFVNIPLPVETGTISEFMQWDIEFDMSAPGFPSYYEVFQTSGISVDFAASPRNGSVPLVVTFINKTTLPNYPFALWDYHVEQADNVETISITTDPVFNYVIQGTHSVSLTASGGGNNVTKTKTGFITVIEPNYALDLYTEFYRDEFNGLVDADLALHVPDIAPPGYVYSATNALAKLDGNGYFVKGNTSTSPFFIDFAVPYVLQAPAALNIKAQISAVAFHRQENTQDLVGFSLLSDTDSYLILNVRQFGNVCYLNVSLGDVMVNAFSLSEVITVPYGIVLFNISAVLTANNLVVNLNGVDYTFPYTPFNFGPNLKNVRLESIDFQTKINRVRVGLVT